MKNKHILGIVTVSMIAVLGIGVISAYGFGMGFMNQNIGDEDKADMHTEMEAMETAVENNDYGAWKSLMEERISQMQSQLTEENFNNMVEMHNNMQEFKTAMQEARDSGDFSQIQQLREEYGMDHGFEMGGFPMRCHMGFHRFDS